MGMMCLEKISYKTFVQTLLMILFQKNYQYGDKVNNRQQTFSMYMQKWLYDANSGYYRQNHVGIAGDFYTAINVSKFFGGAISRYILKMLESQHLSLPIYIVEIGGNNGNLISDIAEFMSAFNSEVFDCLGDKMHRLGFSSAYVDFSAHNVILHFYFGLGFIGKFYYFSGTLF